MSVSSSNSKKEALKDFKKETPRDVFLTIGKKTYSITTPLDEETLERVKELIDQVCGAPVRGVDQEYLLLLTCLQLAYALDSVSTRMNYLTDRLEQVLRPKISRADPAGSDSDSNSNSNSEPKSR